MKPEAVIEAIDLHHLAHGAAINVYSELLHLVMGEDEGYVVNKKAARNIRASLQTQLDEQIIAIHTTNNALPKALQSAVKGSHSMPALKKEYSIQK